MSTSFERHDDPGEDRDEIASRRPAEPDQMPPDPWQVDPWETVPLDQPAQGGIEPTQRVPAADTIFGPPPAEIMPRSGRVAADEGSFRRPDAEGPQPEADPWLQPRRDPWVDVTPGALPSASTPRASRGRITAAGIGLFAAGAVVGALLVGVYTGWGSNVSAALTGQDGGAQNGPAQPGVQGGQGQPGQNGQGRVDGGPGSGAGPEQRLTGTVTGVSSSRLSLKSSAGTATYTITSDTQIVRDGQPASASDLRVGDVALVHVFPASNSYGVLERVIARSASTTSRSSTGASSSGDDGART
jgi:hypothetical protein